MLLVLPVGLIFMLLLITSIVFLLKSLTSLGDERKQMIIQKSAMNTLFFISGILFFESIAKAVTHSSNPSFAKEHTPSSVWFATIILIFTINLYLNKRKYT